MTITPVEPRWIVRNGLTALLIEPELESIAMPASVVVSRNPRFLFIDGLRAIAACCVMMFHFLASGSFYPLFQQRIPGIFHIAGFGYLGVDIFFVISGFVVAFSIRNDRLNGRFVGNFILRRSLRLDPPYLVTIALTLLLLWYYNAVLHQHYNPMPTTGQTFAHLFYLTGILKVQPILPIFWTLCLEVQFYLLFVLTLWVGKLAQGSFKIQDPGSEVLRRAGVSQNHQQLNWISAVILGFFGLWSMAIVGQWTRSFDGWFINDWNLFLIGALLWWVIDRKISPAWLIGYSALLLIASVHPQAWGTWTGLLTVSAIAIAALGGRLETALGNRPLQFLGRISYSLYLLHALIGPQIDGWISWHYRGSLTASLLSVAFSISISIAAAWTMQRYVEQWGIRLGKRLKPKRAKIVMN